MQLLEMLPRLGGQSTQSSVNTGLRDSLVHLPLEHLSRLTYPLSATLESLFTGSQFTISHQNLPSLPPQMNLEPLFLSLKAKNILLNNA